MEKIIIIKYGELTTKKKNINFFLKTLKRNISNRLHNIEHDIYYDYGRMYIYTKKIDTVVERLKTVFGIYEIVIGYKDDSLELDNIKNNTLDILKNEEFRTFKIITKRSNKNYPLSSMEISKSIGGYILKNIVDVYVDVHQADINMEVEIRKSEVLYYFQKIKGIGGYPVGTLGKGMLMLSGGIDSPVAGYLTIKRGVKIEAIYFDSPPHTSIQAKEKVIDLSKKLAIYNTYVKVHVINFTKIQESILKNIPHEYLVTIMRRMMYRISAKIANEFNCQILINGESIGQVASQTLTSMQVINEVINLPVIRPVACFDKMEIIDIARRIETYDISTRPYEDCCTIFVPEHPVINPSLEKCQEYEKLIDYETLIEEAISTHEIIKVDESYQKDIFNDLL